MKVAICGAGPAGLYTAILLRRARPDANIEILEQNAAGSTFGFGVVLSEDALSFLRADDPDTTAVIEPALTRWSDIEIRHRGARIRIDGIGFTGIGRLELIGLLSERAASLGIHPRYETRVNDPDTLADADLVIGADGINSVVRGTDPEAFGETIEPLSNRFVWYGCHRDFDALTQTFIDAPVGRMNAHHYSYAPGKSTFIIEMTPDVFVATGFGDMAEPEYRAICEDWFAETLEGAGLVPNNSVWRRFPQLRCSRWYHGNRVLVGDALHTAHFSIGSGTRLALEDAIALVRALEAADWDVAAALPAYQRAREPVLEKIVAAARRSAAWYENYGKHMDLDPHAFARSYILRAGRLTTERLQTMSPKFAAELAERGLNLEAA